MLVVWNGRDLVFSIEEHKEGRVILSHETCSLMDGGAAIERRRERALDQAASRRLFISGKRRHVKAKRIPCHSSMK